MPKFFQPACLLFLALVAVVAIDSTFNDCRVTAVDRHVSSVQDAVADFLGVFCGVEPAPPDLDEPTPERVYRAFRAIQAPQRQGE